MMKLSVSVDTELLNRLEKLVEMEALLNEAQSLFDKGDDMTRRDLRRVQEIVEILQEWQRSRGLIAPALRITN